MIPLKLTMNGIQKDLWEIMEPEVDYSQMTEEEKISFALENKMFPTEVKLTSETYCRNSDRTANFELENINNVNAKAKPEFTWQLLKAVYVQRLLDFLEFKYDYKDSEGDIQPVDAPLIQVTYLDFNGMRTINAYLGASIEGTLKEYISQEVVNNAYVQVRTQYWEDFRIAFPER